ncbi:redoxin domain-containing protein [Rhodoflexus caldus]|uniref:redoxin domain-containing protein n=1 Tax=Rhodoflexus caldus TaxID=2891236 RepID=UPI00202AB1C4|nr:redoxin domain-containing protein [Rhodoflexus caldus]
MKKLLSSLWALLLLISAAQAQYERLKIQPAQPKQGEPVSITYTAANGPLKSASQLFIVAYAITADESNERINVKLTENNGIWQGTFTPPANTVGIFWDIRAGENADTNDGKGYYTLLTDKNGAFLPHAQGSMGVFYETTAVGLLRERNNAFANQLFEREMQQFPANKSPYVLHVMSNLLKGNKKEEAEKHMATFEALIRQSANFNTEREVTMAAQIARMLGKKEEADRLDAEVLQRFPTGQTVRENMFTEFRQAAEIDKKRAIFSNYRNKIGMDEKYSNMATMIAQEYFNNSQWQEGVQFVRSLPLEGQTLSVYVNAASALSQPKNAQYDLALSLTQSVIDLFQANLSNIASGGKPDGNAMLWGLYAKGVAGGALLQQGKAAEALPLLEAALSFAPVERMMGSVLSENHAQALAKAGDPAKALETIADMVRKNKSREVVKESLKIAYIRTKGSETGWEEYLKGIEAEAKKNMVAEIAAKMIDEPAPGFTLTNLAGETVSLEGLRGKVVVIDFWATWCGPCIASFPGMKKAQDSFKGRSDVQFLFINSWERVEDKKKQAGDFIAKKEYDFNVPMDEDNSVIGSYKVSGIPTKFVIDKQGRIRFKSIGYNGSTDLTAQEMQVMIDLLAEM